MKFDTLDTWWWPFLFILLAGWLTSDGWRFLGVFLGEKLSEESDLMVLVRCVATALVAGVIANLIVFPSGALGQTPLTLRVAAAAIGFAAYMTIWRRILVGILVGEAVLLAGLYFL